MCLNVQVNGIMRFVFSEFVITLYRNWSCIKFSMNFALIYITIIQLGRCCTTQFTEKVRVDGKNHAQGMHRQRSSIELIPRICCVCIGLGWHFFSVNRNGVKHKNRKTMHCARRRQIGCDFG